MRTLQLYAAILLLALLGVSVSSARAATQVVIVGDYYFDPTSFTINPGDTVEWQCVGRYGDPWEFHNIQSVEDNFTTLGRIFAFNLRPGDTAMFTFTNAGVYEYICTQHFWTEGGTEHGFITAATTPVTPTTWGIIKALYR